MIAPKPRSGPRAKAWSDAPGRPNAVPNLGQRRGAAGIDPAHGIEPAHLSSPVTLLPDATREMVFFARYTAPAVYRSIPGALRPTFGEVQSRPILITRTARERRDSSVTPRERCHENREHRQYTAPLAPGETRIL